MTTVGRVLKNFFFLTLGEILYRVAAVIFSVYLARTLGPSLFGTINWVAAIVAYLSIFINFGFNTLGVRMISTDPGKNKSLPGKIISIRLGLWLIGSLILTAFAFFGTRDFTIRWLIVLYCIATLPYSLFLEWWFQGIEKMEYIAIGKVLSGIVSTSLVILLVKGPEQILLVPWAQFAGNGILAFSMMITAIIIYKNMKLSFKKSDVISLLKKAAPFTGIIIALQLFLNADIILIGIMKDKTQVGYYNAAYKFVWLFVFIGGFFFQAIFPLIPQYYKENREKLKMLLKKTGKIMLLLGIPISLCMTIIAKPLILLVFGEEYAPSIPILQVLIWNVLLIFVNNVYAWGLLGTGGEKVYFHIVVGQLGTNILLNILLIPKFGAIGASAATLAGEAVGLFFYMREFSKVEKINLGDSILKPVIASVLTAAFLYYLSGIPVYYTAPVAIVIYFALIIAIKGITRDEINIIINSIKLKLNIK
ncbi:MAG: flippase [Candidatus Eremiobacteraeota bacterium]|nr:flippase [Candidatus Eremiobacteraeota bacterium]